MFFFMYLSLKVKMPEKLSYFKNNKFVLYILISTKKKTKTKL